MREDTDEKAIPFELGNFGFVIKCDVLSCKDQIVILTLNELRVIICSVLLGTNIALTSPNKPSSTL